MNTINEKLDRIEQLLEQDGYAPENMEEISLLLVEVRQQVESDKMLVEEGKVILHRLYDIMRLLKNRTFQDIGLDGLREIEKKHDL